jgi:hypothetical protein
MTRSLSITAWALTGIPPVLGAFARLLGAMRDVAPGARLYAQPEGGTRKDADPRLEPALDRYLSAIRDEPG